MDTNKIIPLNPNNETGSPPEYTGLHIVRPDEVVNAQPFYRAYRTYDPSLNKEQIVTRLWEIQDEVRREKLLVGTTSISPLIEIRDIIGRKSGSLTEEDKIALRKVAETLKERIPEYHYEVIGLVEQFCELDKPHDRTFIFAGVTAVVAVGMFFVANLKNQPEPSHKKPEHSQTTPAPASFTERTGKHPKNSHREPPTQKTSGWEK